VRTPLSGVRPRPLLASEALREDLAPLEPLKGAARVLCLGAAAMLGAVAALEVVFEGRTLLAVAPVQSALGSALLVGLAIAKVGYRARAAAMTALGGALLVEALGGVGPAGGLRSSGSGTFWELARILASTLLPAALLFRAHYRAYPRARLLLGWGLALALPFVVRCGYIVLLGEDLAARLVAGATIGSVLLSLVGFMGAGTTAMAGAWAVSLLLALSLDIAARWFLPNASPGTHLVTALGFLAGETLAAFGLFQLMASRLACDARKIDVLRGRLEPRD
jgi:hypothetical protein